LTTLIAEDGTGVVGANTYALPADAGAYHLERPTFQAWTDLTSSTSLGAVTGLLVDATRKLDATYRWSGAIATSTQGLALPRQTIWLDDGRRLDGVAQVALAADATSSLALRIYQDRRAAGRLPISESIGDYSVTYGDEEISYPELDQLLAPITDGGGMGGGLKGIKVVRWS
jgi:hypothetical protein